MWCLNNVYPGSLLLTRAMSIFHGTQGQVHLAQKGLGSKLKDHQEWDRMPSPFLPFVSIFLQEHLLPFHPAELFCCSSEHVISEAREELNLHHLSSRNTTHWISIAKCEGKYETDQLSHVSTPEPVTQELRWWFHTGRKVPLWKGFEMS